ncbi:hypothetical protein IDJ77_12320 [Mucilaginibacter sp. ZT4R22]|uniref:DUF3592 domain-containing protein n=1 Tax=Mucilaginibacter pankratovii TaxID=2772110 RepID=A0ABR7WQV1_9SPHI|nr:hypothetical protein [Mucilaginibacter pankratovii]MBD1364596.1 hypothetical protein [Mucilaginibacter pankratovii]
MIFFALLSLGMLAMMVILVIAAYFIREFIYTHAIRKKFRALNYSIISITKAGKPENYNEDPTFDAVMMKGGGRFVNYLYKKVTYLDGSQQKQECMVAIKKFPLLITSVDYIFADQ